MSPITCYLAGPIHHDSDPDRWRNELIGSNTKNNVELINPLDIEPPGGNATPEEIVKGDLEAIDRSDAILVRWKTGIETAGTPMEMMYAAGRDIPIVVWYEGIPQDLSPWVEYFADEMIDKGSEATTAVQRVV